MPVFTKESLELLRQRIDIVDVISDHVELKRMGKTYKALCPFHDEKSPSFVVERSDSHYHCYGCGAHGDAIQFLMDFLKLRFHEAVEALGQRFDVALEEEQGSKYEVRQDKKKLKELLGAATEFYHAILLYSEQGREALKYLYRRGLTLEFLQQFSVGFAPNEGISLFNYLEGKGFNFQDVVAVGLAREGNAGRLRPFYQERITFPICDPAGGVIGFSARKFKEDTYGGKYINTPETILFKKYSVLFGLNYSRRRIAKENKALVVEGQIDALRLIQEGLDFTVAPLGTAFGEGHVQQLVNLGVQTVFLAFDGDRAGKDATVKVGDLLQRRGIEVFVLPMPDGMDPDNILNSQGIQGIQNLFDQKMDYLTFLVEVSALEVDKRSPAGKNLLVQTIGKQVRMWENPLMVHESLRRLAFLLQLPEEMVGVTQSYRSHMPTSQRVQGSLSTVDPDRILEGDFLRWLTFLGHEPRLIGLAEEHIREEDLHVELCRKFYKKCLGAFRQKRMLDKLDLAIVMEEEQLQALLSELLDKKVNKERGEEQFVETMQKILDRNWLEKREEIRQKIQSSKFSDDEVLNLAKQFDALKRKPLVVLHEA